MKCRFSKNSIFDQKNKQNKKKTTTLFSGKNRSNSLIYPGPKKVFSRMLLAARRSRTHSKKSDFIYDVIIYSTGQKYGLTFFRFLKLL